MTCYKPPANSFDPTRPMFIAATGSLADNIDPSDLMSTFPSSDADWMGKESLAFLDWDMSGSNDQQAFSLSEGTANGLEFPNSYMNSDYTSPMGYKGYTVATEDALSYASPVSDGESGTWSPTQTHNHDKNDSHSPAAASVDNSSSNSKSSASPSTSHRLVKVPSATGDRPNLVYESASSSSLPSRKLSASSSSSSASASATVAAATTATTTTNTNSNSNSNSNSNTNTNTQQQQTYHPNGRSGRSAADADPAALMKRKKAAHNAIEKRYRTNMNAKFLALGNAIPRPGPYATQLASNKGSRKSSICATRDSLANGTAQQQQQQQNKSEILTNALAYIRELQEENARLKGELMVLKENLLPRGNIMWRR